MNTISHTKMTAPTLFNNLAENKKAREQAYLKN
jgi:hypothetical protein